MKKIAILCVRALLWPIANRDIGTKIKVYSGFQFFLVLMIVLVFSVPVYAQTTKIKPLNVGEKVPDSFWEQQYLVYKDGKTTTQTLAQYKGKLLILDFWATWCGACIAALPKLDSINANVSSKVVILPITYQTEDEVKPFLKKRNYNSSPFIINDKYYGSLFPHHILPHYVWINEQGKVVKFTESVGAGHRILTEFAAEGKVNLANKVDPEQIFHDKKKPFLIAGNGGDGGNLIYHSLLTGYSGKIAAGTSVAHDELKGWKIGAYDVSLAKLFRLAFGQTRNYLNDKNVIYSVKDTSKLTSKLKGMAYANWKANGNAFSYEISAPNYFKGFEVFEMMQQELVKLFGQYSITEEKRLAKVFALVCLNKQEQFATTGQPFSMKYHADGIAFKNASFDQFIALLEQTYFSGLEQTIVDETAYTGKIDLELNTDFKNIDSVNNELAKYGLKFIHAERLVKKLVIADRIDPVKLN